MNTLEFETNTLIKVFLTLRALEDYEENKDFGAWCRSVMLPKEPQWLTYFEHLKDAYLQISRIIGPIDSYFASMDYQLKSGEYHDLLQLKD